MSFTVSQIISSITGKTDDDKPKSSLQFSILSHDIENDKVNEVASIPLFEPEIAISKVGNFITVDLIFANNKSLSLNRLWSIITLYGDKMNLSQDDTSALFSGNLTIVPISLTGKAYVNAANPIYWTLMPRKPLDEINTIRLLFESDSFVFYEGEEFDIEAIKAAVDAEIEQEEAMYANMEQKIQEQEEYRDERNAKIEAFRGAHSQESPLEKLRRERIEKIKSDNGSDENIDDEYDEYGE